ncbi:MAG: efflux RND transporter periplasmic adaptor subunit [Candidatus Eremiobacteraeota bacterium]|nr:efflux RND transporter periplasmic adaptor subunit [Candidatus Eremiobacteraeota bacterium]
MRYQRVAIAITAIAAIGLSGCSKKDTGPKGPPPLNVDTALAMRRDIATFVNLDGQIAPLLDATLAVQQSGPLVNVYVNEGQRVSAGQLIAKVDDSTMRAQLSQDEALISQAAARAQSSALGVPIMAQQVSSAVQTARNTLSSDRAALANAQLVYNQNMQLFHQGYVSQTALEQSRSAFVAAQQRVQSDQQSVTTAQSNTQQTGVSSANAAADRAAISSAQAQANTLRTQIGQTALYAPFSGTVTQRLMDPGAMAGPTAPVARLSQIDTVYINVNVPDEDLSFIHAGTPVTFTTGSVPGKTFSGSISDVNAVPTQGTLSYRARIREANPGGLLRGGMLVSVTVEKEKHVATIVVPRSAVGQNEKGSTVFLVANAKAVEIPVTVGIQTDTLSEVHGAQIRPGAQVITTRPDALQNGSVVAVNGAGAPGAGGPPGPRTKQGGKKP